MNARASQETKLLQTSSKVASIYYRDKIRTVNKSFLGEIALNNFGFQNRFTVRFEITFVSGM
jgi:hypothetical protein